MLTVNAYTLGLVSTTICVRFAYNTRCCVVSFRLVDSSNYKHPYWSIIAVAVTPNIRFIVAAAADHDTVWLCLVLTAWQTIMLNEVVPQT